MFTRDQIEEIKKKLIMLGTKDTQFPDAHKLNGEEIIAIVQDGENKKIPLSSIINDDFINVSKDTTEILTLSTAVSKIDINNRKLGQVITFKDSANSWAIHQFTGSSLDNWNDISLWKSISGIDELKSQADTNTSNISSLNTEVSTLQSKVDENTTSISQINNNIADNNKSIAQINTTLEEHTESINAKIITDRIENGAVTSEKISSSAFDSTLSVSGKIAPADAVGSKLTELESKTDQQFSQLKQLINGGYLFKGIVTPSSDVITTDNKIFVVASEVGTYTNFGGYVVTKGELAFLYYDTEWHKGSVEVAVEEEEILATDEDGFAIVDNQLHVGMKYDKNGFDIAKIADHAKEMLESRLYNGAFASVNEDGLFVVDENLNIGVKVDNAGVHAPNILEYEIINE